jgi:hypothetical protein
MSTYWRMWEQIKALSPAQVQEWIDHLRPSKGISVDFYGVDVCDVDLLEALMHMAEDLPELQNFLQFIP